jgi:hypothetical protein
MDQYYHILEIQNYLLFLEHIPEKKQNLHCLYSVVAVKDFSLIWTLIDSQHCLYQKYMLHI